MKIAALLSSFIYVVSSSLLYPVLFLLSLFTLWILFHAGKFCAEWVSRNRFSDGKLLKEYVPEAERIVKPSPSVILFCRNLVAILRQDKVEVATEVEYFLQESVWNMTRSLDFCRMMVRIGPMLGLMGTLIPMGTGLAALSQGDMGRLSSDLVVAFTTTVVGLAQGGIAYTIYNIRKRWVEKDILQMEYIAEILMAMEQNNHEVLDEKKKISVALGR